jgi:UDP-galactopyranose mutase
MKILIVGAGISGATVANKMAVAGNSVLVVDRRTNIAGNCYDYMDENGILIHKYGAHIFHTNFEDVWQFVRQFTAFNTYMHRVIAIMDGQEVNIPFNLRSLYQVFPHTLAERLEQKLLANFKYNTKVPILEFQGQNDDDLKFLADYVYKNVFFDYNLKQWGLKPDDLDGSVTARVPIYISQDTRYFQDKYQGIPIGGYTEMVRKMLSHKNIEVRLDTDYKAVGGDFDKIVYTGSIDEFFDYKHGQLPYRSVNFKTEEYDVEFYQSNSVVNYPNNYDFTRIIEHKQFYNTKKSGRTVISKEYSEKFELGKNERFYPIQSKENDGLYGKYLDEAKKLGNVHFLGRLGDYKYYNMDLSIKRGLELAEAMGSK